MPVHDVWPVIDPSRFIHVITFLDQTIGSDVSGSNVRWLPASPPDTAYAQIEAVKGTDLIKAGQDVAQQYLTVTMNYRAGRKANQRIQVPGGGQYIIQAVENVRHMNMFLVLTCLALGLNE